MKLLRINSEAPMHVRWSCLSIPVVALIALTIGCRGAGPQRQQLVLTEDPTVRTPDVQSPPQRLAVSERSIKATGAVKNSMQRPGETQKQTQLSDTQLANTQLGNNRAGASVRQVAHSTDVKPRQIVAKQPANSATPPSSYKPSRSDAVEALLAANRASIRSKQGPVAGTTPPPNLAAPFEEPVQPTLQSTAKHAPVVSSPAKNSVASSKPSAAKTAEFETENVAKKTTGKTVRFSDLPEDVRRRAMDRLIENLAKEAVPSTQPTSLKQEVANALDHLPKLEPLRKTKPEISPTRIASKHSVPTEQRIERQPVTPAQKSVERFDAIAEPAVESVAVVEKQPPPRTSMPVSAASKQKLAITLPVVGASGFELPPMDQIRRSLPKLDAGEVAMASANRSEQNDFLSPQVGPLQKNARSSELSVSALARELEDIPHALERDSFRVSRVGLPDPDDYCAIVDEVVQQASSQASVKRDSLLSVELASSGDAAGSDDLAPDVATTLPTKTDSSKRKNHNHVASESMTPALDLPTRVESEPAGVVQSTHQLELPAAATVASVPKPNDVLVPTPREKTIVANLAAAPNPHSLSDRQLYDVLLKRLNDPTKAETPAERSRRQIMARHLMVLAGDRESAVAEMQGLSQDEQQFLRNQLEGLYTMVDPKGHPVAGRRFTQALPKLRQATQHLSAAADSLEVRGLEFCTEIEAYGQVKPFPKRQFYAGQAVILYCEVDRFTAKKTASGYETHLKGSYEVFSQAGEKIVSQLLPADKQISSNFLRDYFVAYQMNLPSKLTPGKYRLQLTMEDIGGEKYGQSEIEFVILPAARNQTTGGVL